MGTETKQEDAGIEIARRKLIPALEIRCNELGAQNKQMLEALKAAQSELLQTNPSEYTHEVLDKIDAAINRAERGETR